jgi:hypothetical protein
MRGCTERVRSVCACVNEELQCDSDQIHSLFSTMRNFLSYSLDRDLRSSRVV